MAAITCNFNRAGSALSVIRRTPAYVLDASSNSCINSCINLYCMIFSHAEGLHAELCRRSRKPRRVLNPPYLPLAPRIPPGGAESRFFFVFFAFFSHAKNCMKIGTSFFAIFCRFLRFPAAPTSILMDFGLQNRSPEGLFSRLFSYCGFGSFFCIFFEKKRSKAKNEKVGFVL